MVIGEPRNGFLLPNDSFFVCVYVRLVLFSCTGDWRATADNARLYFEDDQDNKRIGAWCADDRDNQWLQIDLGQTKTVRGIATQGNMDFICNMWAGTVSGLFSCERINAHNASDLSTGKTLKLIERFLIECRTTKTNVNKPSGLSEENKIPLKGNENSKLKHEANYAKCRKTRATKSCCI